jgi:hypothetical protein
MNTIDTNRPHLTVAQAVSQTGLTRSYFSFLLRAHKLEGFRYPSTKEWFIYTDSLEQFLSQNRKPGPKGPRGQPPSA